MLDGGAMFGVVPKSIWQKTNPADNNNMVKIAARCLLIEDGDRLVLIDTGMGDKQSKKFFGYYYRWGKDTLKSSLKKHQSHHRVETHVFSMRIQEFLLPTDNNNQRIFHFAYHPYRYQLRQAGYRLQ